MSYIEPQNTLARFYLKNPNKCLKSTHVFWRDQRIWFGYTFACYLADSLADSICDIRLEVFSQCQRFSDASAIKGTFKPCIYDEIVSSQFDVNNPKS